ncbi:MAG: hypothetical protein ACYDBV_06190 [Nitrospiria bacterium]
MPEKAVKVIGSSGQISLGKEYAGRTVMVEEIEKGVWVIKTARVIPDNELWMHKESTRIKINKAVKWAEKNKPSETDMETLSAKIG